MNRRDFLRKAGAVCGVAVVAGCADNEVGVTDVEGTVAPWGIDVTVFLTNPREDRVDVTVEVEAETDDGETYSTSTETSIGGHRNTSVELTIETDDEISSDSLDVEAWVSEIRSGS